MTSSNRGDTMRLKSSVLRNSEASENDIPVDGIYGSNGFYFQQRRGRLDLRGLAQIDLERIVRDVDIDVLQMNLENITFCNLREEDLRFITDQHVVKLFRIAQLTIEYLLFAQEQLSANLNAMAAKYNAKKKSLIKKRKELAVLEESSKNLQSQLKTKKKGIHTLETMLKENSTGRASSSRRKVKDLSSDSEVEVRKKRPTTRSLVVQFFVVNTTGLCVEFNLPGSTTMREIRNDNKLKLVSKYNSKGSKTNKRADIALTYQGRVILDDCTLDDINVHNGDTIVAVLQNIISDDDDDDHDEQRDISNKDKASSENDMLMLLAKQNENFAHEIREGLVQALGRQQPQSQPDLYSLMDERLSQIKNALQNQLDMQFNQLSTTNKPPPKYIVGELESDNDERLLSRNEWEMKLRGVEDKLGGFDMMKSMFLQQAAELAELRRKLDERSTAQVIVTAPTQTASQKNIKETVVVNQPVKVSKWKQLAGSADEGEIQVRGSSSLKAEIIPVVKEPPQKVKSVPPAAAPLQKVESAPPKKLVPPVAPPPQVDNIIEIIFPIKFNVSLQEYANIVEDFSLRLPRDTNADDVIFEIRRKIAEKVNKSLATVALNLDEQVISLGVDVDEKDFTPINVAALAKKGELTISILRDNPMTDAQIDLLVNEWEKSATTTSKSLDRSSNRSGAKSKASSLWNTHQVTSKDSQRLEQSLRLSKYLSDSEGEKDVAMLTDDVDVDRMRESLNNVLESVSDMEGLTDDELKQKMDVLNKFSVSAHSPVGNQLRSFRSSVVGDVNNALDSGTEEYIANDRKFDSMRISLPKNTNRNSLHITNSGRKPRNYDDDNDDDMTLTGSLSKDLRLLQSSRSTAKGVRYSSDSDYNEQHVNDVSEYKGSSYADQYYQQDINRRMDSKDDDSASGKDDETIYSARGTIDNGFTRSFGTTKTFSETEDSLFDPKTHQAFDLERTVDTDLSLPGQSNSDLFQTAEIRNQADRYERGARNNVLGTPPASSRSDRQGLSTAGTASPFDNMITEFDDTSLALSESNDDAFDLDSSSKSNVRDRNR